MFKRKKKPAPELTPLQKAKLADLVDTEMDR